MLQKRRDKYARFKDLDNRLKTSEEKFTKNHPDQKTIEIFVFEI